MSNILLEYFNNDELAASVWPTKYAQKGETSPEQMHWRMAKEFARVDVNYQRYENTLDKKSLDLSEYGKHRKNLTEADIFKFFDKFRYIVPQGSVMANLGSKEITSLSNCFVIGTTEDSYGGILKKDEELVQLMKRRGGVGIDISTLRPNTTPVTNSAKTSTGAVSFMHRFSNSTREVAQGGRRGALMCSIDINHPDVLDFIKIKRDRTSVTGANISIKLNDEFMKAVEADDDYILRFPIDLEKKYPEILEKEMYESEEYNKLYPVILGTETKGYTKKIKAKELWDEIIISARDYAEPGLMFWNKMVEYSPDGVYKQYKQVTTNPCSEIAMQPFDACRLIAVNLYSFVNNPFTDSAKFDFKKFYEYNYEAMRLSDNLIDLEAEAIDRIIAKINLDPESFECKRNELELWEKIKQTTLNSRRTGLGLTALGDTLAALNIKYDSDQGLDIIKQIMSTKMESELDCTIDLSLFRGNFTGWDINVENNEWYAFVKESFPDQYRRMNLYSRRNVSFSTIAPTGTVSLLCQTTSGLEPLFSPYYMRRKKVNNSEDRVDFVDELGDKWTEYPVLHPKFKDWIVLTTPVDNPEDLTQEELKDYFEKSPWFGSTANDIDWIKRIEIQVLLQKYITHSISSTINLPETVSYEEVSDIYLESWRKGLKGVTVYRDGSRSGVLVSTDKSKEKIIERPNEIECSVQHFKNERKNWIAFVGILNDSPYEIFTGVHDIDEFPIPSYIESGKIRKTKEEDGKSRYDFIYTDKYGYSNTLGGLNRVFNQEYWNYSRFVSALLRQDVKIPELIKIIEKLDFKNKTLNSWQSGVIRSMKPFIKDGDKVAGQVCPECHSHNYVYENGCAVCKDCGYTACG